MNVIYDIIEKIEKASEELNKRIELIRKYHENYDYESLATATKKGARIASNLSLLHREALMTLHEAIPSLPGLDRILDIECEAMGISVERVAGYDFPLYKISLPILLPNMRRRREDFNNAITMTVNAAVNRFCIENDIQPFDRAMVIFFSYCYNPRFAPDNDNKEASVIMNGLIGNFLIDDSPFNCNTGYYSKVVEENQRTEIYIVGDEHDMELLSLMHEILSDNK